MFDPERIFAGEIREGTTDQVILTVASSARDDNYPAYSLAIAFRCIDPAKTETCSYYARMLRTGKEPREVIFPLVRKLALARSDAEARNILDRAGLEWVETEMWGCEGAILAFDAVRKANWTPDLHMYMREQKPDGEQDIVIHPSIIRVTVSGDYFTASYKGWVTAAGVPAEVIKLVEVLDKCWKPAKVPPPWRRPGEF
ncbi:MAG: hypothetical protein ACAH11_01250 [Sphingomonas sp.]